MNQQCLVVNGCSYSFGYYSDGSAVELAQRIGVPEVKNLSLPGSCNSRIIRTTLQHSYQVEKSCFYLIGLSFLSRSEIPVGPEVPNEGRWISITNYVNSQEQYEPQWSTHDTEQYLKLRMKQQLTSTLDRLQDLLYRVISMVNDLRSRGHEVLIYRQVNDIEIDNVEKVQYNFVKHCPNLIDGLKWCAIPWQYQQGAQSRLGDDNIPWDVRHIESGHHGYLNDYLYKYIDQNLR